MAHRPRHPWTDHGWAPVPAALRVTRRRLQLYLALGLIFLAAVVLTYALAL